MIDLHCHSTASDGTLSPAQLANLAKQNNLTAVALTDHDTTDGLTEYLATAQAIGFHAIPGIELATKISTGQSCHILGLFIQHENDALQAMTKQIRLWRHQRNIEIIHRLNQQGYTLSLEEVQSYCGGQVLGRPHIAQALAEKHYCKNSKQAFERLIGRGCPAYTSRQLPQPEECIRTIHQAGGVAIYAHPYSTTSMTNARCRESVLELKEFGIDGIEAYYSLHSQTQTAETLKLAEQLDLLITGGSDFHGAHFPDLNLGSGYGKLNVPDALLQPLQQTAEKYRNGK